MTQEQQKLRDLICNVVTQFEGAEPEEDYQVFWQPDDWAARGERYGRSSKLVIVHDGGTYAPYFNADYGMEERLGSMNKALADAGYFAEPCETWYTAIYKD